VNASAITSTAPAVVTIGLGNVGNLGGFSAYPRFVRTDAYNAGIASQAFVWMAIGY
jgi:hypothetical protein